MFVTYNARAFTPGTYAFIAGKHQHQLILHGDKFCAAVDLLRPELTTLVKWPTTRTLADILAPRWR